MFAQLIASAPVRAKGHPSGIGFSVALHGSVLVAALLVGARPQPPAPARPAGIIYVSPPTPAPATSRPLPTDAAGNADDVVPAPTTAPDLPSIDITVAPVSIPTSIPEPGRGAWPGLDVRRRTGPRAGVPGGAGSGDVRSALQVEVPAQLAARSPRPQYPEGLRRFALAGTVRALFVVDTLGRVEPESVRLLTVSHPLFGAAVRATLPRMRFEPARVGGRAVRQLVEFPVVFTITP